MKESTGTRLRSSRGILGMAMSGMLADMKGTSRRSSRSCSTDTDYCRKDSRNSKDSCSMDSDRNRESDHTLGSGRGREESNSYDRTDPTSDSG